MVSGYGDVPPIFQRSGEAAELPANLDPLTESGYMIERKYFQSLRAQVREFVIPPIRDGLILGRQSAIGHVAIGKALSLLSTTSFERVPVEDDVIGDIIVRSSILRKLEAQRLVNFVLTEIKPLMGPEEILHLGIDLETVIEVGDR